MLHALLRALLQIPTFVVVSKTDTCDTATVDALVASITRMVRVGVCLFGRSCSLWLRRVLRRILLHRGWMDELPAELTHLATLPQQLVISL